MNVPFKFEQIQQIDLIKNAMQRDRKNLGCDCKSVPVNDLAALEYALSFTSEVIGIDNQEKR